MHRLLALSSCLYLQEQIVGHVPFMPYCISVWPVILFVYTWRVT